MSVNPDIELAAANNATELDTEEFSVPELTQEDLDAISEISSLTSITFIAGDFHTYAPLAKLPELRSLAINHWSSDDLSSVGEITQLVELDLGENEQYDNIDFVGSLVNLEVLNLTDGQFSDLSPISGLRRLRILNLTNCDEVSDCSPLAAVTSIKELHLGSTGITDISPLAALTNLQFLDLRGTDVTDLAALHGLPLSRGLRLDAKIDYENAP